MVSAAKENIYSKANKVIKHLRNNWEALKKIYFNQRKK